MFLDFAPGFYRIQMLHTLRTSFGCFASFWFFPGLAQLWPSSTKHGPPQVQVLRLLWDLGCLSDVVIFSPRNWLFCPLYRADPNFGCAHSVERWCVQCHKLCITPWSVYSHFQGVIRWWRKASSLTEWYRSGLGLSSYPSGHLHPICVLRMHIDVRLASSGLFPFRRQSEVRVSGWITWGCSVTAFLSLCSPVPIVEEH